MIGRLHNLGDVGARGVFEPVRPGTILTKGAVDEGSLAFECGALRGIGLVGPPDVHYRRRDRDHPQGGEYDAPGQQGEPKPRQGPGASADAPRQDADTIHVTHDSGGSRPAD